MTEDTKTKVKKSVLMADIGDLPPTILTAVEILGVENFVELCYSLGGIALYIPKFERVSGAARDRLIVKEFNGGNYIELAKKYDLTEAWVRQIVAKDRWEKNQTTLF